jgi:hypothetical protein
MSTEHHSNGEEPQQERLTESWREVGEQIQGLVSRIADAFREAWSDERQPGPIPTSQKFDEELRASADRMERVFKRVASETEDERAAAMKSTRKASDQTFGEIRVAAARGLRALNEQIDELAKTLDRERAARKHDGTSNGHSNGNSPSGES